MNNKKKLSKKTVHIVVILYAIVVLTLILLSASNYPVQWRDEVNKERMRYLEVYAQALRYYFLDHDGVLPDLPTEPSLISNTDRCVVACPELGRELRCYNLQNVLVPSYMEELLSDPLLSDDNDSGFYVYKTNGGFTLGACHVFFRGDIRINTEL